MDQIWSEPGGGRQVSVDQVTALIDFMDSHRELALGYHCRTKEGRHKSQQLWSLCADVLNGVSADCAQKTPAQWRMYYNEYKCKVGKKIKSARAKIEATGSGRADLMFTPLQQRLFNILYGDAAGEQLAVVSQTPPSQAGPHVLTDNNPVLEVPSSPEAGDSQSCMSKSTQQGAQATMDNIPVFKEELGDSQPCQNIHNFSLTLKVEEYDEPESPELQAPITNNTLSSPQPEECIPEISSPLEIVSPRSEVYSPQPRVSSPQPRTTSLQPGISTSQPGTSTTQPGTSTSQPGTSILPPGISSSQPGISTSEPGPSRPLPEISRPKIRAFRRVSETRTSPVARRRKRRRPKSPQAVKNVIDPALQLASERLEAMERLNAEATRAHAEATNRLAAAMEKLAKRLAKPIKIVIQNQTQKKRYRRVVMVSSSESGDDEMED